MPAVVVVVVVVVVVEEETAVRRLDAGRGAEGDICSRDGWNCTPLRAGRNYWLASKLPSEPSPPPNHRPSRPNDDEGPRVRKARLLAGGLLLPTLDPHPHARR